MRLLGMIAGLGLAGAGNLLYKAELALPPLESWECKAGLCGTVAVVNAALNLPPGDAKSYYLKALSLEPGNPFRWAELAENSLERGEIQPARTYMAEAARLGAGLPPILMRVAIMFLRNEEPRGALPYTRATLGATREFDGIIYMYYARSGIPVEDLIRSGVPVERAAGQAWLRFLTIGGAPRDFEQVWLWLKQNGFIDDPLAGEYVRYLLRNKKYVLAAERWEEQIRDRSPDYRRPELLSNRFWKYKPLACPLDWLINPVQGVETSFSDGLLIRFDTRENLQYEGVVQQAVVSPGPYRLRTEVSSEGITTNEGPCFRVVDAERSERLDVYSRATLGTTERGPVNLDFAVPAGTSLVNVQVFRRPSMKFDNKIKGTFRVHSISLAPINARTGTTSSAANAAK